jgi:hypothetical protein
MTGSVCLSACKAKASHTGRRGTNLSASVSVYLSAWKAKVSHPRKRPNYQYLAPCGCQLVRLKLVIQERGDLIISTCVFISWFYTGGLGDVRGRVTEHA